ncbi:MAG: hypothetical protein A2Z05_01835 [Chloroflexi bacterium RBG_16_60_22]|nr:MAG: hypothetical protein A2Z05_01835 [Chloroflexi bacterium RBG_16_60_22]
MRTVLIGCLLVTSFVFGGAAYAQDEELPDPGLTPDSPFYFFDTLGKNIGMAFAFGSEAKAGRALQYAEERLAEARAMAEKNRTREMERAANDYDGFMAKVNQRLEEAKRQGISDNISERIALATRKHLAVLDKVKDRVPEPAKEAIKRAREASENGQLNALRALGERKPERAIDINAEAIEDRLERARVRASENVTPDVEEALDYAARLTELEEEMQAIAEEKGLDITKLRQRLAQATSNRLDVLTGVYEKAPENARKGIANAIENSVKKYEREVEKLREKNALGDIPDAATLARRIQKELQDKLHLTITDVEVTSDNVSGNVTIQFKLLPGERTQEKERERSASTDEKNKADEMAVKAREAIAEAQEEMAGIRARAEKQGVTLNAGAVEKFHRLIADAKTAYTAGKYEEAARLAKQAEEVLDDLKESVESREDNTAATANRTGQR